MSRAYAELGLGVPKSFEFPVFLTNPLSENKGESGKKMMIPGLISIELSGENQLNSGQKKEPFCSFELKSRAQLQHHRENKPVNCIVKYT